MNPVFYEQRSGDVFVGELCMYPFPSHVHDEAEIVCLTRGCMRMNIDGKELVLQPGDIAVVFPSVPHSYPVRDEQLDGVTLIFSPSIISEFSHHFRCMTVADPCLRSDQKDPALDAIIAQMQKPSFQQNSALKQGYLHLFLSYLFTCLKLEPIEQQMQSGLPYQVLHYISAHFTEPLNLESTAQALGISRIHLSHIFSQQLRINFRQYINALRIDRACFLLRDPAYSVSQIADLCGYGNPRTFHRAFLAQCQMPPKQYRAQFLGAIESDDMEEE